MTDIPEVVPRDDRAWPRQSVVLLVLIALAALVAGGLFVRAAWGRGTAVPGLAVLGLVVGVGLGYVPSAAATRHWIAGYPVSAGYHLVQLAGLAVAFVVAIWFDGTVGGSAFCGLMAGLLAANLVAIRAARANREAVDRTEASIAAASAEAADSAEHRPVREAWAPEGPPLGHVLLHAVTAARRRWLAWSWPRGWRRRSAWPTTWVNRLCSGSSRWAGSWSWWPRSAWSPPSSRTRLLQRGDPAAACVRGAAQRPQPTSDQALLGVWSDPPQLSDGRMPRPEQVDRADDDRDDLLSFQGSVVVHEAWVDTGPRHRSKPRWVVADQASPCRTGARSTAAGTWAA